MDLRGLVEKMKTPLSHSWDSNLVQLTVLLALQQQLATAAPAVLVGLHRIKMNEC